MTFDRIVAKRDGKTQARGPFYGDPPCEMCVPPWEDCPKCPHAFALRVEYLTPERTDG